MHLDAIHPLHALLSLKRQYVNPHHALLSLKRQYAMSDNLQTPHAVGTMRASLESVLRVHASRWPRRHQVKTALLTRIVPQTAATLVFANARAYAILIPFHAVRVAPCPTHVFQLLLNMLTAAALVPNVGSCVTTKRDGQTDKKEGKHQKRNSSQHQKERHSPSSSENEAIEAQQELR